MSTAYSGDGITFPDNSVQATAPRVGMVNRIINGDMRIDQRNGGASVTNPGTASLTYTLDRWAVRNATDSAVNVIQSTDTPNATLSNSIELDVTTADTSIAAGQIYALHHRIEGFNVNDFGFGKAGTRNFTVSFWHKHTKTGTYCVGFTNAVGNRAYPAEYTQTVADTWEQATVTVPVDTTGTWLATNGLGLLVYFVVSAGSNFYGTAGAWAAANTFATANQVNALDATSNFFRITGVQLEKGSTATDFDYRPYGTELALCQRYYQQIKGTGRHFIGGNGSVSGCFPTAYLRVTMRSAISLSISSASHFTVEGIAGGGQATATSITANAQTLDTFTVSASSGGSTSATGAQVFGNTAAAVSGFSAEL